MDRNIFGPIHKLSAVFVATREGGVDRNIVGSTVSVGDKGSPPARVAWIET